MMKSIETLKTDINNAGNPMLQCKAAYNMRFVSNNDKYRATGILLAAALQADYMKLQATAVDSLKVMAPEYALSVFKKAISNPDPLQRSRAFYNLGSFKNESIVYLLIKGLDDSSEKVRKAAVISCGKIGSEHSVIRVLEKKINDSESEFFRKAVMTSIESILKRINSRKPFNPSSQNGNGFNKGNNNKPNRFNSGNGSKRIMPKSYCPKAF